MATHYYYKDVTDPDDNSIITPKEIDTILMRKRNVATNVSKDKESGLVYIDRDLSNYFELADIDHGLPSSKMYGGESTHFYVKTPEGPYRRGTYTIHSVSGNINQGKRVASWGGGSANRTWTVAPEYKNRYMYWVFSTYMSSGRGRTNTALRAGILEPGTNTLHIGNPTTYTIGTDMDHRLYLFECSVTADKDVAPNGYIDLADLYAGNKAMTDWWLPLLFFKNIPNQTANRYDTVTITGLPRIPFNAALQQVEWDEDWKTPGYYHHGKDFHMSSGWDSTTWRVSRAHGGRAYTYAFGVPMSTGV